MKSGVQRFCAAVCCVVFLFTAAMPAGAVEFSDADEIVNSQAVDTMVQLGILNGKEDGSYFDPTGIVTRAEMAKMICLVLNGGTAPEFDETESSFSDTQDSWAAGYIEYCCRLGILSGRGDGTFDPEAAVTGIEAAKMLLVSLGYHAGPEGFTGPDWASAVTARAREKHLFDALDFVDITAPFTRDNAAQLVCNALNAVTVTYGAEWISEDGTLLPGAVAQDNEAGTTLLSERFQPQDADDGETDDDLSGGGGGGGGGFPRPVTYRIGSPSISSVTGTAAGTYAPEDFTVSPDKTTAADKETVTLTVTYIGGVTDENDIFAFTPSAASGADGFTAASGLAGIYPNKQWTCCFTVDGADVVSPSVSVTSAAVYSACGYMTGLSYDGAAGEYHYRLESAVYGTSGGVTGEDGAIPEEFSSSEDYTGLFGTYVQLDYERSSPDEITVTGVTGAGGTVGSHTFGTLALSNLPGSRFFYAGRTTYEAALAFDGVPVYCFRNGGLTPAADGNLYRVYQRNSDGFGRVSGILLVSGEDGDGLIDYLIVFPAHVAQITSVDAGGGTVTAGGASYPAAELEGGASAGDELKIVPAEHSFDGAAHLTRAEQILGNVTAVKTNVSGAAEARIGGVWYRDGTGSASMLDLDDVYAVQVIDGYYFDAVKSVQDAVEDLIYVYAYDSEINCFENMQDVRAVFPDGTKRTIHVSRLAASGSLAPAEVNDTNCFGVNAETGLYTFIIEGAPGTYSLTRVDDDNALGLSDYDGTVTRFDAVNDRLCGGVASYEIAPDAYVLVEDALGFHVTSGSALTSCDKIDFYNFGSSGAALTDMIGGAATARVILLKDPAGIFSTAGPVCYGYVTEDPEVVSVNGSLVYSVTFWNGSASVAAYTTDKAGSGDVTGLAKNTVITFLQSDSKIDVKSVAVLDGSTTAAVTAYSSGEITFDDSADACTIGGNTVILYVDVERFRGVLDGSIRVADQDTTGTPYENVYYVARDNEISLLVVDVQNDILDAK